MSVWLRFLGALIITYGLSQLFLRLLGIRLKGWPLILLSHAASLGVLVAFVGVLKAYFVSFVPQAGFIYVIPQMIWLFIDLVQFTPIANAKR